MKKVLAAAVLAMLAPHARAQVTVKLGTMAPTGSAWHDILKEMGQRWEQASGGRVKVRVYPGGSQGNEGEMLRKLQIGQLQAAAISNVGLHDVVPEAQAMSIPMLFADEAEMECAFRRVSGAMQAAFERRGLVVVQWSRLGTAAFFCNAAFRTPAEMASAKMFAWDGDPGTVDAWRTAGFRPVVLSSTDLVPALQTGMIDCVGNVPAFMLAAHVYERARYMIDVPLGFALAAIVVRKDAWERIPADVRPRLLAVAQELGLRVDAEARRLSSDAVKAMTKQGLQVVTVAPEAWRRTVEKSWPVLRERVVTPEFFDEVKGARDACRASAMK